MVDTARFAMKSSTAAQVPPPLVVLKMPPPTLPTNITCVLVGSMTIERTRPPMLPGPSHVHAVELTPAESSELSPPLVSAPPWPAPGADVTFEVDDPGDVRLARATRS